MMVPATVLATFMAPLLAALTAVLAGCTGGANGAQGKDVKPPAPAASSAPAFRVGTAPVALRDVTYTIEATGSIEAEEEIQVVAGVEGVVTSVRFREGDAVTPDTVLATIDPDRFRIEAERARANHEKIEAQYHQALADLKRREELLRQVPPLVSEEDLERARQDAERLRASVAEAKALYDLAELDRRRSIVRPLVAGIINSKSVSPGQHTKPEAILATLVDTSRLRLRFRVSEQESVRLRDGTEVRFTTSSAPGRQFTARVFHVSASADSADRMVVCLARVAGAGTLLKPGFFAEVRAEVESHKGAIVIPERAVLPTDKGFVVFEVVDGRAVMRRVSLGLRTRDGGVEILDGLGKGAVVVTDGGDVLRDGAPVQVVEPPA
jgi:multidrug efflux system membrane fusion protein